MSGRAFLFIFLALSALVVVTSPPVLPALVRAAYLPCGRHGQVGTLVETKVTPTPTPVPPTFTPTASAQPPFGTATTDPFGHLPTATPLGRGGLAFSLPTPSLGELPPTFTSTPTATALGTLAITAPLPIDALWGTAELATESMAIPALPTPAGLSQGRRSGERPPDRLVIARLGLACMPLVYLDTLKADQYGVEKFADGYRRYMERVPRVRFFSGFLRLIRRRVVA